MPRDSLTLDLERPATPVKPWFFLAAVLSAATAGALGLWTEPLRLLGADSFAHGGLRGFSEVMGGSPAALFLFALLLPFRRPARTLETIGVFVVAQGAGLLLFAGLGLPPRAGDGVLALAAIMAAAVVAIDNLTRGRRSERPLYALAFGLLQGLALGALNAQQSEQLTALVGFQSGVWLAEGLLVGALVACLWSLEGMSRIGRRAAVTMGSVGVVLVALAWSLQRVLA